MMGQRRNYVFLGLTITSTWGNGHATTYRGLLKELAARGHSVTFLERDVPWYSAHREFSALPYGRLALYGSLDELKDRFTETCPACGCRYCRVVRSGRHCSRRWVKSVAKHITAFYDIDTPVTLASLRDSRCEYLSYDLIARYDLYLSFTGGPTLAFIERRLGSPCACPLYCSVDPTLYFPEKYDSVWDLAYLGTYAPDRQPSLDSLLLKVAAQSPERRLVVAGPQYPEHIQWPQNVTRIDHLPAAAHCEFYNSQLFALNITRSNMFRAGYSPSVRLFEAAACGTPIITDEWPGLADFFQPHSEIIPAQNTGDVLTHLKMSPDRRLEIAAGARRRTLQFHTAAVRAAEFESYVDASLSRVHRSNNWERRAELAPSAALLGN